MEKKTFNNVAAQGDLLLRRISKLPDGVQEVKSKGNREIVAHSETGHHHYFNKQKDVTYFMDPKNPMVCYLRVEGAAEAGGVDLIHDRPFDTHTTINIPGGIFELRRQRESAPEGWRRVED